ncbi:hypothetical protein DP115_19045 [Brasilonema octagenarum UFV-OR1]|uniref:Uncharacterized protein n=1 Tax=Brasilonema octagenarum UFV-OR1 TaxID=417115 RepID=A0ABX1MAC5_9CYAN|nr:hypothetical protein [Brasilonema octagenarum UFV-OR1]
MGEGSPIFSRIQAAKKSTAQLKQVCQTLPRPPLSLWDAEYGCTSFVKQTTDIATNKLFFDF